MKSVTVQLKCYCKIVYFFVNLDTMFKELYVYCLNVMYNQPLNSIFSHINFVDTFGLILYVYLYSQLLYLCVINMFACILIFLLFIF